MVVNPFVVPLNIPSVINPHTLRTIWHTIKYMNQNRKSSHEHKFLFVLMLISIVVIYANTFLNNTPVWYALDALYVLIPLIFTCCCMRSVRHGAIIAILLWVPAIATLCILCMVFWGSLVTTPTLWSFINMYQLIIYSYFLGTRLRISSCSDRKNDEN